ncbi:YgjV family protein [Vibrio zhugei]|uniref:YgjV family protein n=1 Tax=Vibrio zhugei TaxID=2479546 RepID=A0ABV7C5P4_9VIBR|nr:YgjV family protein [Vibrio zhugei]
MDLTTIEIMGYAASIMVALSLTMKDIVKLRIINFIGCIIFCIYGSLIGAWPVVATNVFISIVNVYYLYKMRKSSSTESV